MNFLPIRLSSEKLDGQDMARMMQRGRSNGIMSTRDADRRGSGRG